MVDREEEKLTEENEEMMERKIEDEENIIEEIEYIKRKDNTGRKFGEKTEESEEIMTRNIEDKEEKLTEETEENDEIITRKMEANEEESEKDLQFNELQENDDISPIKSSNNHFIADVNTEQKLDLSDLVPNQNEEEDKQNENMDETKLVDYTLLSPIHIPKTNNETKQSPIFTVPTINSSKEPKSSRFSKTTQFFSPNSLQKESPQTKKPYVFKSGVSPTRKSLPLTPKSTFYATPSFKSKEPQEYTQYSPIHDNKEPTIVKSPYYSARFKQKLLQKKETIKKEEENSFNEEIIPQNEIYHRDPNKTPSYVIYSRNIEQEEEKIEEKQESPHFTLNSTQTNGFQTNENTKKYTIKTSVIISSRPALIISHVDSKETPNDNLETESEKEKEEISSDSSYYSDYYYSDDLNQNTVKEERSSILILNNERPSTIKEAEITTKTVISSPRKDNNQTSSYYSDEYYSDSTEKTKADITTQTSLTKLPNVKIHFISDIDQVISTEEIEQIKPQAKILQEISEEEDSYEFIYDTVQQTPFTDRKALSEELTPKPISSQAVNSHISKTRSAASPLQLHFTPITELKAEKPCKKSLEITGEVSTSIEKPPNNTKFTRNRISQEQSQISECFKEYDYQYDYEEDDDYETYESDFIIQAKKKVLRKNPLLKFQKESPITPYVIFTRSKDDEPQVIIQEPPENMQSSIRSTKSLAAFRPITHRNPNHVRVTKITAQDIRHID